MAPISFRGLLADGSENGFDIDLMRAICVHLGLQLQRQRYVADNFDGIFDGLGNRTHDAVISGATLRHCAVLRPYLVFNQGVAVNRECTPDASAESDFRGLTAAFRLGIRRILWPGAVWRRE